MKTSIAIAFCTFFVIALLAVSCGSPQSTETESVAPENPLVGVWKLVQMDFTGPEARTVPDPQPGIGIFTERYVTFMAVTRDTPRAELPENPTDAQLAEAFNSFLAGVSTYEAQENTITLHPVINKDPNTKPSDTMTMEYQLEGDTLSITPKGTPEGPIENPYSAKFIRVE